MKLFELYRESFRGLSKQVWYLALMMFVNRIGTLILPFLTLYTTQELGWSKMASGAASSAFGVGSLCGAMLGGYLVDRIGYWRVIVIGQLGAGLAFLTVMYVTSFYPLLIGLFLSACIADILRPGVMTGVSLLAIPENRTRAISLMRVSFNLGLGVGPAIAGIIIALTTYRAIFIIDGITCLLAGLFGYFMINRDRTKHYVRNEDELRTAPSPWKDGPFLGLILSSLLMLIAFFQLMFTIPLYMKEELGMSEKDIGLYYAINGLLIVISEMPIVYLTERYWRLMPAMILGSAMIGVSYLCLLLPFGPWSLLLLYLLLISYGEIVNFPFINSITLRRTQEGNIGKYMGTIGTVFSLSLIISPSFGTYMIDHHGYNTLWMACGVLSGICCIGYFFLDRYF